MNVSVKLKSGDTVRVNNLKEIKEIQVRDSSIKKYTDFENFTFYGYMYIFVGDNIFNVDGDNIEYINFHRI